MPGPFPGYRSQGDEYVLAENDQRRDVLQHKNQITSKKAWSNKIIKKHGSRGYFVLRLSYIHHASLRWNQFDKVAFHLPSWARGGGHYSQVPESKWSTVELQILQSDSETNRGIISGP